MNKNSLKGLLIITLMFIFPSSINAKCTIDEILKLVNAGYNKTEISALCENQDGSNEVSIKPDDEEPEAPKKTINEVSIKSDNKEPAIVSKDGQYVKYSNNIVYDKKSNLEWFAGPDKGTGGFAAKKWINKLKIDGGRWRMPTIRELKGLLHKTEIGTNDITSLLGSSRLFVWSSKVKGLYFYDGTEGDGTWRSGQDLYNHNYPRAFAVRSKK